MAHPDPPLSPAIRAYLDAFTRSVLATKSTASDEERAAADEARALSFDRLLCGTGIDPEAEGRVAPRFGQGVSLRLSPLRHNLGRKPRIRPAA